jgi:hypothetical protein
MGWSMGWGADDAHQFIHNDGRTLRPFEVGEPLNDPDEPPYHPPPIHPNSLVFLESPLQMTSVWRYSGSTLSPEYLHVHRRPFTVTKWESKYSSVFSDPVWITKKLTPVIDNINRVIGHVGWIDGIDLCVPTDTIREGSKFWEFLQMLRQTELREQALALRDVDRAFFGRAAGPVPMVRPAPQIWESEEYRHQTNLNYFLSGGGKAIVGEGFEVGYSSYLWPLPEQHGFWAPKHFRSSGYRFLVFVDPEGYVQAVLGVEKVHVPTRGEMVAEFVFGVIDVALAILLVVDIVTIPVVLLRLGLVVAERVAIQAVRLVANELTKAVAKMAERDVLELLKLLRMGRLTAEELKFIRGGAAKLSEGSLISADKLNQIIRKMPGAEGIARKLYPAERPSVYSILNVLKRMENAPNLRELIRKMLVDLDDGAGNKLFRRRLAEITKNEKIAKMLADLNNKQLSEPVFWRELRKLGKEHEKLAKVLKDFDANPKDGAQTFFRQLREIINDVEKPPWADIKDLKAKRLEHGRLAQEEWHEIYVTPNEQGAANQIRVLFRLNGAGQLEADIVMMH